MQFFREKSGLEAFQTYRTRAAKAVAKFGGRYEQVLAWYQSPEYSAALEVRDVALARNLILVDGYREPCKAVEFSHA